MKRRSDKNIALKMRSEGMSYSQIQKELNVGKGTLSSWLSAMPLSKDQISILRDKNPIRIERYRNTMAAKKNSVLDTIFQTAKNDIGTLSRKELFIAGLMLYWGEGTKAQQALIALTNTNPAMLQFFMNWLKLFDIDTSKIRVKVHLYADMDKDKTLSYWSKKLGIPLSQFHTPYIKKTMLSELSYRVGFKMGTCSVIYGSAPLYKYIMMCLKVFENPIDTRL